MDQQLLWIVAAIGTGTLAGTFFKMKGGFGPMNLRAIGIVLIAILATLLAIAKLDNITAAMGILGAIAGYLFGAEAKDSSGTSSTGVNASGSQIGDNAKIAGRDINETINSIENMLGEIRGLTNATINNVQRIDDRVERPPLMQRMRSYVRWESQDEAFIESLNALSRNQSNGDLMQRWIETCLNQQECASAIQDAILEKSLEGWRPREIDFDNFHNGIHVNISFEREFNLH